MSAVGKLLLSPVLTLAGVFDKKKPKPVPMQQPVAQTRPVSAVLEAVASRQGSRANQRAGMGGVEASGGTKTKLGA